MESGMNSWLFAGCMFLIAVALNTCLWFGEYMIKQLRIRKKKHQQEQVSR